MRVAAAIAAALLLVLGAPLAGQLRGAVQEALPGQYRLIGVSLAGLVLGAALVGAVVRIRERRRERYLALAAAMLVGAAYAVFTSTGNPDIDMVERFHFVEYGGLTFLFHRVWRDRGDLAAIVLPASAAALTGIADEWFQFFVPLRVGEFRDVLLNGVAVACGLLFSVGVDRERPLRAPLSAQGRRLAGAAAAATIAALAIFLHVVHLGSEIHDPSIGTFRSRFTRAELERAQQARVQGWHRAPPLEARRFSREDHYLAEAVWHVVRRNEAERSGDLRTAWYENLILERFYAPILDVPTYAGPPARWAAGQRADIDARRGPDDPAYVSDAQALPIYTFGAPLLWGGAAVLLGMVSVWMFWPRGGASTRSTATSTP